MDEQGQEALKFNLNLADEYLTWRYSMPRLTLLMLFMFLFNTAVHAENRDQWTCTDQATFKQGSVWYACGVGEGMDEGSARGRALHHALDEFNQMCDLSSDCKRHDTQVQPKRTTCFANEGWWKCYRMVEIRVD